MNLCTLSPLMLVTDGAVLRPWPALALRVGGRCLRKQPLCISHRESGSLAKSWKVPEQTRGAAALSLFPSSKEHRKLGRHLSDLRVLVIGQKGGLAHGHVVKVGRVSWGSSEKADGHRQCQDGDAESKRNAPAAPEMFT